MTWGTYLIYLATVGVFFATPPGTSQILFMSNSLRLGLRRSLPTLAGDLSANALQMLAAGFGLAAIIATSATALTVIKWLGVAYLAWFGLRLLLAPPPDPNAGDAVPPRRRLFLQGFLTSGANPEAVFFFAALFPQFIDPARPIAPQIAILGLTYLMVDLLVLLAMGAGAARLLRQLRDRMRLLNRIAGSMMLVAAGLLGLRDVHAR